MPRHPPQLFRNEVRLPVTIVYAVNHGVLKGDAPSCFPKVPMAGSKQLLHRISPVHRHDFRAGFPVRRMEGDGQRKLKAQLRKALDAGDDAAGGQGDVPHADVQPLRAVHQLQKPQHVVQIVQRLPNPHQNDIGNRQTGVLLSENHLIQQLRGRQASDLSRHGGRAERAAHQAAHL